MAVINKKGGVVFGPKHLSLGEEKGSVFSMQITSPSHEE